MESLFREEYLTEYKLRTDREIHKDYVMFYLAVICGTFFLTLTIDIANAHWNLSDEFTTIGEHILNSISRAIFISGIVVSLLCWVGVALNFFRVLSSKKKGVDSGFATPYKYHVLSKENLTDAGINARARLFVCLGLFFFSMLMTILLTSLISILRA